jgi:hypothetical protein
VLHLAACRGFVIEQEAFTKRASKAASLANQRAGPALRQNFSTSRASGLGRGVLAAAVCMGSALDWGWKAARASTAVAMSVNAINRIRSVMGPSGAQNRSAIVLNPVIRFQPYAEQN